jgi:hypothetical protein
MRVNQRVGCHAFNMGFNVKAVMFMGALMLLPFALVFAWIVIEHMDD